METLLGTLVIFLIGWLAGSGSLGKLIDALVDRLAPPKS